MNKLLIEPTYKFPRVVLDPFNNVYEIEGHSLPENAVKSYQPVLDWLDKNLSQITSKVIFKIQLDYINSSSARVVVMILNRLEKAMKTGLDVTIHWFYDDEDFKEEGEMYSSCTKVPFELVPFD